MALFERPLKKEFFSKGFSKANLEFNQDFIKTELVRLKNKFKLDDIIIDTEPLVEDVKTPDVSLWVNNKVKVSKTSQILDKQSVYRMSRNNTISPSYSMIANNKVNNGKRYKTSILLKKADVGSFFGLRVQGEFPHRLDAIFNLEAGTVKEASVGGNFDNIKATMTPLGNGWYKCVLFGNIKTNNIKIILGPTSKDKRSKSWEGAATENCEAFFIPSSLKIEEVSE
jgi:hypothetical protein